MVTQAQLKEVLHYDPITGAFTWLKYRSHNALAGAVAGTVGRKGYRSINVGGVLHLAHRLAWLYAYGFWPVEQVDHKNGIKDDNSLANLRLATNAQNHCNRGKNANNKSGYKGVVKVSGAGRWIAYGRQDHATKYLGVFSTPEEASAAYEAYAAHHNGAFYHMSA